jgi:hypothetical protein
MDEMMTTKCLSPDQTSTFSGRLTYYTAYLISALGWIRNITKLYI